eukprot:g30718.t1
MTRWVHPGLLQSPHSPFGSPGVGSGPAQASRLGYSDEPALLHPGAVRAIDPIHRPISAPPPECGPSDQADYGDIRCDPLYQQFWQMKKGQNVNLPKPLDPCQEIVNHRANSVTASEFGPASEATEKPGAQKNLGFAPATGFSSYGHVPRSPSPPWDGAMSSHVTSQDNGGPLHSCGPKWIPVRSSRMAKLGFQVHRFQASRWARPRQGWIRILKQRSPGTNLCWALPLGRRSLADSARRRGERTAKWCGGLGVPGTAYPWSQVPMSLMSQSIPPIAEELHERREEVGPKELSHSVVEAINRAARGPGTATRSTPPKAAARVAEASGVHGPALKAEPETSNHKPRSSFKLNQLEEMFSNNTYMSHVYSIARDQAGCRMLQHKLDEGGVDIFNAVFKEVANHAVELMMDPFGTGARVVGNENYLCQKLMEMCTPKQLEVLVEKTFHSLVNISLNMHGARAVQKLIDVVRVNTLCTGRLVAALESSVVALTKDANGNHVVQRCLESLPCEAHGFIFRLDGRRKQLICLILSSCRVGCTNLANMK